MASRNTFSRVFRLDLPQSASLRTRMSRSSENNYAFFGPPGNFAPFTLPGTPGVQVWAPGTDSQTLPFGLNNQSDVVGFYYEFGDTNDFWPQAFVWYGQKKTWQKLEALHSWYTAFRGINDKGTIVREYQDRTGIHGVVLTPAGK